MAPNKSWSRGRSKNANKRNANKGKNTGGGRNSSGEAFNIHDYIDSSYRPINVNINSSGGGGHRTVHVRTEIDEETSARICSNMLTLRDRGQFDPMNCLWTRFGIAQMGSECCKLWFGVHGKVGLFGPRLPYDEIPSIRGEPDCVVTERKYRIFLETIVIPELKSRLSETDLRTCWFQTADILPECVFSYLNTIFGNRILAGVTHTEMSTRMDIPPFSQKPSQ